MNKDAPDTFPEAEQTRWQETLVDDVFLASVRVQLTWRDVEAAVAQGAIVPQQAHALWASWAMPGSATRLSSDAPLGQRSNAYDTPSTLESARVGRAMPEVERPSRLSGILGFVMGALVVLGAVAIYNSFFAV
jgi:hypothetical protein